PEQRVEVLFPPANRGEAKFAFAPSPCVDPEHRQLVPVDFGAHGRCRQVVDERPLDRGEAAGRGRAKTCDQRALSEEVTEIGGKAGHTSSGRTCASAHSAIHYRPRPDRTTLPAGNPFMRANDAFHIAVIGGDGIGPEVMAPALEILRKVEAITPGLKFRFSETPAGATHYRETGRSMPDSTIKLCEEADAILLGACGLPSVRYPDNTEIMPQVELRFIFDLYAGVRPARLIPGVPSPIVDAHKHGIDFVLIRESTEGLFASMGKGVVTHD